MLANSQSIVILAQALDMRNPGCMVDVMKLLAAVCIALPEDLDPDARQSGS